MKDLTHYFNSPPQGSEDSAKEKSELDSSIKKKKKKLKRKKKDKKSGLCKTEENVGENKAEEEEASVFRVNEFDDSANLENETEESVTTPSIRKTKRKRKSGVSEEDKANKRIKRKLEKGRLRIIASIACGDSVKEVDSAIENELDADISDVKHVSSRDTLIKELIDINLEQIVKSPVSEKSNKNGCVKKKSKRKKYLESPSDTSEYEIVERSVPPIKLIKKSKEKSVNRSLESNNSNSFDALEERNKETELSNGFQDETDKSVVNCNVKSLEKQESVEKRNSLFNYYMKVDKATYQSTKEIDRIEVKAIIHTPPNKKLKSPDSDSSGSYGLKKVKRTKKLTSKEFDEITVVSSEIVTNLDVNGDNEKECQSFTNSVSEICTPSKLDNKEDSFKGLWKMRVCLSNSKTKDGINGDIVTELSSDESNNVDSSTASVNNDVKKESLVCEIFNRQVKKLLSDEVSGNDNGDCVTPKSGMETDDCITPNQEMKRVKRNKTNSKPRKCKTSLNKTIGKLKKKDVDADVDSTTVDDDSDNSMKLVLPIKESNTNSKIAQKKSPTVDIMAKFLGKYPKEMPKPMIDPAVLQARQKFLESGIPDVLIKQKSEHNQSDKNLGSPAPFPRMSHIQQRNPHHIIWNLPAPKINLLPNQQINFSSNLEWTIPNSKSKLLNGSTVKLRKDDLALTPVSDVRYHVKELNKNNTSFDVHELWSSIKELKAGSAGCEMWSEVFKPRKSTDFLGNGDNIQKLNIWMKSLKNKNSDKHGNTPDNENSEAEFVDSDSEENCNNDSTCIISGPNGCGKTSAVFAVASELGYKVFEVNASSHRNGKKVLTDLSEATQSHQVEHSQVLTGFLKQGKRPQKKKKKKDEPKVDASSKKRSLILVEDADLLFHEKDDGFVGAIATLAGSSKRPLVLVVNDFKAPHLIKLHKVNQLQLKFSPPSLAKLGVWLQLIALANGMKLNSECAEKLALWSDCDVRKCLLQLQILVQSFQESECNWPGISNSPTWCSSVCKEHVDNKDKNIFVNKAVVKQQLVSTTHLVESLVTYDLLMNSSSYYSAMKNNPCPIPKKIIPGDSTSLLEDSVNAAENDLSNQIADYLYSSVATCITSPLRRHNERWKTNDVLMSGLPLYVHCSHEAVFSEYLPSLRLFGRVEKSRLALNNKRSNRFFNYLNGLGIHASETSMKYICDALS